MSAASASSSSSSSVASTLISKVAVIIGVGPGLGSSLARRFSHGGYSVALLSRSLSSLTPVHDSITSAGGISLPLPTDASDFGSLKSSFEQIKTKLGDPSVLIFNAGAYASGPILSLDPEKFTNNFRVGASSLLVAAQQCVPHMLPASHGGSGSGGSVLVTGATASLRGSAGFAGLAAPKFALSANAVDGERMASIGGSCLSFCD